MSKLQKDLTTGSVFRCLIMFALPFLLSNIVQSLYNVADMYIVGKFDGPVGISGVNIGGQVTFLMTNIVVGLSTGGTIIIAQYLGAKREDDAKQTISTMLVVLIMSAVVITALMLIFANQILKLIQTPADSFAAAKEYLDVTVLGTVFIFGYNALSAVMRGMGDSKTPMIFVCVACVVNIFADLFFVGVLKMGAKGAAIATVMSQALSMILCVIYLKKNNFIFDFSLKSFKFYKSKFNMIMKVGIPTAVQNVITNISFLVITTLVNSIGVMASAAVGVVGKFNGFAIMPVVAISSSISAMIAQNSGANKPDRVKKTLLYGFTIAFCITLPVFIIVKLFPGQIIEIFDKTPQMVEAGKVYLSVFAFDYLLVPFSFCFTGLMTGAGHTKFALLCSVASALLFRIPVSILFGMVLNMGLGGIALAVPVSSFGGALIGLGYFLSGKWKKSSIIK